MGKYGVRKKKKKKKKTPIRIVQRTQLCFADDAINSLSEVVDVICVQACHRDTAILGLFSN